MSANQYRTADGCVSFGSLLILREQIEQQRSDPGCAEHPRHGSVAPAEAAAAAAMCEQYEANCIWWNRQIAGKRYLAAWNSQRPGFGFAQSFSSVGLTSSCALTFIGFALLKPSSGEVGLVLGEICELLRNFCLAIGVAQDSLREAESFAGFS